MMPDSSKMIFEETDPDMTICKSVLASLSKKHRRLPDEGYDLWNYVLHAMQSFVHSHWQWHTFHTQRIADAQGHKESVQGCNFNEHLHSCNYTYVISQIDNREAMRNKSHHRFRTTLEHSLQQPSVSQKVIPSISVIPGEIGEDPRETLLQSWLVKLSMADSRSKNTQSLMKIMRSFFGYFTNSYQFILVATIFQKLLKIKTSLNFLISLWLGRVFLTHPVKETGSHQRTPQKKKSPHPRCRFRCVTSGGGGNVTQAGHRPIGRSRYRNLSHILVCRMYVLTVYVCRSSANSTEAPKSCAWIMRDMTSDLPKKPRMKRHNTMQTMHFKIESMFV